MGDVERVHEPIWIACEGSRCPPARRICSMCGAPVPIHDGLVMPHQRKDIIAMVERGDFDE